MVYVAKKKTGKTLSELILELVQLQKEGYGDFKVVIDDYIDVHGVEANELKGKINIY